MKIYRKNAAAVLFNKNRKVLLCERLGHFVTPWQFPQGGIEDGESPEVAAARELQEETSVSSVKLVKTLDTPMIYDFPSKMKENLAHIRGINFDGQEQYWSLFYFTGDDAEINLDTQNPEFQSWRWVDISEADKEVVEFKKDIYRQVVTIFKPLIDNYKI